MTPSRDVREIRIGNFYTLILEQGKICGSDKNFYILFESIALQNGKPSLVPAGGPGDQ